MASKMDRRDFLKLGLAATATAAVGIGMSRPAKNASAAKIASQTGG